MGQTVSPPAPSPVQMAGTGTKRMTAATISANTKRIGPTLKVSAKAKGVILLR